MTHSSPFLSLQQPLLLLCHPNPYRSVPRIHTKGLLKESFYHVVASSSCFQPMIMFFSYFKVLLWVHGFIWGGRGGLFMFYEGWGWRPHLATDIFLFDGLLWLADRVRIVAWVHPLDLILCIEHFEKPHPVHSLKEENLHETWWMAAVDMQLVSNVFVFF